MSQDLQADYEALQSMIHTFEQAAAQFDQLNRSVSGMAQTLDQGALLGIGGAKLVYVLESSLAKKATAGAEKFRKLASDVRRAMDALNDADEQGASKFRD